MKQRTDDVGAAKEYVDGEHCVTRTVIICVLCLIHARMVG